MRKFLLITLSIASFFGLGMTARTIGSTTPITSFQAQQPNCNNPQSQSDMNACAGISYQNADRKLNQVYQQLIPQLPASRKQKLITAQQAWIKFRDASCEFETSAVEGGSMSSMISSDCLTSVTENRTQDLERYLKDISNK